MPELPVELMLKRLFSIYLFSETIVINLLSRWVNEDNLRDFHFPIKICRISIKGTIERSLEAFLVNGKLKVTVKSMFCIHTEHGFNAAKKSLFGAILRVYVSHNKIIRSLHLHHTRTDAHQKLSTILNNVMILIPKYMAK